ncbi:MAG: aminotransferase, partial [Actinomycetota bacterium]
MAALNRDRWPLDLAIVFLNHCSFGAVPRQVLQHQQDLRDRMESDPVRFFVTEHPGLLGEAVQRCARFVGADPEGFAFVTNATTGVNTVLRAA